MRKLLFISLCLITTSALGQFQQKSMLGVPIGKLHPLGDPVGFWLFNEGSGNKVFDLSGNGYHSTNWVGNTHWVAGQEGSAVAGDGSGDSIHFDSGAFNLQPITVIIKVKAVGFVSAPDHMFSISDEEKIQAHFRSLTTIRAQVIDDVGNIQVNFAIVSGEWLVLAMTIDANGGFLRVYKDGVLQGTPKAIGIITFVDGTLSLLSRFSGDRNLDGEISYVMIYNRALTASEIELLYREPFVMFKKDDIAMLEAGISVPGVVVTPYYYRGFIPLPFIFFTAYYLRRRKCVA